MLVKLLTKVFGSRNDRTLRRMRKVVEQINRMEPDMEKLSDDELKAKTNEFRARLEKGESLDSLIPEAFAVVREASKRVFGMRHFDVQLLGGMVLNDRCIAEMRTGEGKTLTATLPAYLNALSGRGVHVVTVNDYLAQRDAENNRPLFEFLGLSIGINLPGMPAPAKREAYAADITYGTNNEYGFDYLRDNMAFSPEERVQRKLHYALVDEVDSILIDEARTPLIISGPAEDSSEMYIKVNKLIPKLIRQEKEDSDTFKGEGHFSVDEKARQVHLTERGLILIEEMLVEAGIMDEGESLYSPTNIMLMHHVTAALRAHVLFTRDVDYIVKDGEVIIVDEHTGRTMQGRRWSDGLHQAVEAKEGVEIQNENQTLASITFQNYFRLYEKLAGMTGTADTEAFEFSSIYKLDTIVVPTNRPMIRKDMPDLVYMTEKEKIGAIIEDIRERTAKGQPVLVGTISIEKSEVVSHELTKAGIEHKVLNAKFHAMEADIVAQAGQSGAVTIATNMAGRGTDIVLGGSWQAEVALLEEPTEEQIDASRLPLSRLVVTGERHYTTNDDIRQAILALGAPGTFMTQDVDVIQQQIERLPWIKQASVRKQWPDELKIHLVEYVPVARWNDLHMVDAEGKAFSVPAERAGKQKLPLLYGPEGSEQDVLEGYRAMSATLAASKYTLKMAAMTARHSWQLALDNDVRLELGRDDRNGRLQRFIELYPVLQQQGQAESKRVSYVDLRYESGASVGWAPVLVDPQALGGQQNSNQQQNQAQAKQQ